MQLLGPDGQTSHTGTSEAAAVFTAGAGITGPLRIALAGYGLAEVVIEPMPLGN